MDDRVADHAAHSSGKPHSFELGQYLVRGRSIAEKRLRGVYELFNLVGDFADRSLTQTTRRQVAASPLGCCERFELVACDAEPQ